MPPHAVRAISNAQALKSAETPAGVQAILGKELLRAARSAIRTWPGYAATPLVSLPGLAAATGVAHIDYKDEGRRFGLKSFKALGGAYAVYRVISRFIVECQAAAAAPSAAELISGKYRGLTSRLTVTCATDGNHGRSVAWGAQLFGCQCVIFLPGGVSRARQERIEAFGARTQRIRGTYDTAVHAAAEAAERNGWIVVSDTSYGGYTEIPRDVMSGYSVMTSEILDLVPSFAGITHVILQGGVGGLAAAVVAHMWQVAGASRPVFIVVEPETADCLLRSARAGRRVVVDGDLETIMAGLSCGEPSLLAWDVLSLGVDYFATLADSAIQPAMCALAQGVGGDPPVVAGESGAVGVAFLRAIAADAQLQRLVGLDAQSRVLVFGTEGDTDPELYQRLVNPQ